MNPKPARPIASTAAAPLAAKLAGTLTHRRARIVWIVLNALLIGVLTTGCASTHIGAPTTPPPAAIQTEFGVDRDVVVSPSGWPETLLADVYRPRTGSSTAQPAVLLLHGGAWARGNRGQVERLATRLAARGYVVVNATYRLAPESIWPAQRDDLRVLLDWMQARGPEHGIDPERIGTVGYSAGGHLAALAATDALQRDVRPPIRAVVAGAAPLELRVFRNSGLVARFLGGSLDAVPKRYQEASPLAALDARHPPTFLYHGSADTLVPPSQSQRYFDALSAAGVPTELFWIRGAGHFTAFFLDGPAFDAAINFLDRHLRGATR